MNRISESFYIANFISSLSQVFNRIYVLKNLGSIHSKAPVLECILIKQQVFNLQFETLIKKKAATQVFSCEFCKTYKNTFL